MGAWIEIKHWAAEVNLLRVAPCVGAWIEMESGEHPGRECVVAPCVGAWIEIIFTTNAREGRGTSLPAWERGLKSLLSTPVIVLVVVAPCVGAWIEIGAADHTLQPLKSLPAWERGLKYIIGDPEGICANCRSLRGSVD